MSNQNIETFLTSTNLNQNYKLVCHDVNNRTGVNIDRYPGMERQFQKMAQIVAKFELNPKQKPILKKRTLGFKLRLVYR